MNYIDFLILVILFFYGLHGYREGFFRIFCKFLSLFFGLFFSYLLYKKVFNLIQPFLLFPPVILKMLIFFFLVIIFEFFFTYLFFLICERCKRIENIEKSSLNKYLGIISAVFRGFILITILLTFLNIISFSQKIRDDILSSKIGEPLVYLSSKLEEQFESLFGDSLKETFTILTIKPESKESVELGFKTSDIKIDSLSEQKMLDLINYERNKRGLNILSLDPKLQEVARDYSKYMFENGYFAHDDLEGNSPFDRLKKAGIKFMIAGENLALAPTVELAHQGLMESISHRENILRPEFKKVGIGVYDGGIYGKMFTQEFTD